MPEISLLLCCSRASSFYWKGRTLKVWNCNEQGFACSLLTYLWVLPLLEPWALWLSVWVLSSHVRSSSVLCKLFTCSPTVTLNTLICYLCSSLFILLTLQLSFWCPKWQSPIHSLSFGRTDKVLISYSGVIFTLISEIPSTWSECFRDAGWLQRL